MPAEERGAIAGLATTTKGLGLIVGPLLAGAAIDLSRSTFPETHGYQVVWPVLGLPILLVLPLVARLTRAEAAVVVRSG
jgi:MFS family permease